MNQTDLVAKFDLQLFTVLIPPSVNIHIYQRVQLQDTAPDPSGGTDCVNIQYTQMSFPKCQQGNTSGSTGFR